MPDNETQSESMEEPIISLEAPSNTFGAFLNKPKNRRIFFSGKFGTGKTYFLQDFFKNNEENYDVYHLFPVRYQISSNEDIVDLLKYDILVELLKKYPGVFKPAKKGGVKDSFKLFAVFCKEKGFLRRLLKTGIETSSGMLSLVPDPLFQVLGRLGRPLQDLLTIEEEFQVFKKEYSSKEKTAIDAFIEKITVQSNSVATDYISWILSEKIKELSGDKKSVLILDDFERIDPEHIFRILNILSAIWRAMKIINSALTTLSS